MDKDTIDSQITDTLDAMYEAYGRDDYRRLMALAGVVQSLADVQITDEDAQGPVCEDGCDCQIEYIATDESEPS